MGKNVRSSVVDVMNIDFCMFSQNKLSAVPLTIDCLHYIVSFVIQIIEN